MSHLTRTGATVLALTGLVAFRAGIPLHIFMDLLAETLIARTWTERAFQSTEGTDIIEDVLARAVRDHPDLKEKIGKQSISQLMGFHIQPLYRKDIDEIDAEIAAERAVNRCRRRSGRGCWPCPGPARHP